MGYFKDTLIEVIEGIADVAEVCNYHEEPDGVDTFDYYSELICGDGGGWRVVRDALERIFVAYCDAAGCGWVDSQAEICRRVVGDMRRAGMIEGEDEVLRLVCEVHD